jgi:hypothetical protein
MGIRGVYHASKGPERSRPREIAFGQFTTSSLLQPDPPTPFKFTGRLGLHSPWESSRALALSIAPVPSTCPTSRSVEYGNLKSGQALLNTDRFLPEVARNWRRGDDRNSSSNPALSGSLEHQGDYIAGRMTRVALLLHFETGTSRGATQPNARAQESS